nr:unnamed protein product [Callosobruchus chinensis]
MPSVSFDKFALAIPTELHLADPDFNISHKIELLLGADLFWRLLKTGHINLGKHQPILQNTLLGWIISGEIPNSSIKQYSTQCNLISNSELNDSLMRFWEIENIDKPTILSEDEMAAENSFNATHERSDDGRFIVRLPLKISPSLLGESISTATKRLKNMELKLERNIDLKNQYHNFMQEYITLGHMSKLTDDEVTNDVSYYIPHHFVTKESSLTTRLRVVYDASCKTDTGYSLNDLLLVGPTIQDELFSIVIRFRTYRYILAADITKMYRQVLVHKDDRKLQRICWRFQQSEPVDIYELNTVTYGTACAAFLAIRCLHEIANIHKKQFPTASQVIIDDFYVDDLLTGTNDPQQLLQLYKDITHILESCGFTLNKWISNDPEIIERIKSENPEVVVNIGKNDETHSLGLLWSSSQDCLKFEIEPKFSSKSVTKRTVLSTIARIFDPLGILGPVVVKAKIILQDIWKIGLGWDESLPLKMHTEWQLFYNTLGHINNIYIKRNVLCTDPIHIELHGFADASQKAYGACIYFRSIDATGKIQVNLLCAKSRVAPLKSVTIPRLELCAALLLAQLFNKVTTSCRLNPDGIYLWSDSMVALNWIKSSPHQWKVFVANRVSEIQSLTKTEHWHYIATQDNPADSLSRGVNAQDIIENHLWWHGPHFLSFPQHDWPKHKSDIETTNACNLESKKSMVITLCHLSIHEISIFEKFSSFTRMQRVASFIFRFYNNAKATCESIKGPLTVKELNHALEVLTKLSQFQSFSTEVIDLKNHKRLKRSKLLNLNPFLDDRGILRVGGRLRNSELNFNQKHPIILHEKHKFTVLLVTYEHQRLLHAGPQLLLASIRERYWIVGGRNLIRKTVHNCVRCFRNKPTTTEYLMADLPRHRVTPARPFLYAGIDFCGPFSIKDRKHRNYKLSKAYVCLFKCFTTMAIHLEVATELSCESFLACLYRFFARRGKSSHLFTDNATNFVAANKELKLFLAQNCHRFNESLSNDGITWHFIPPRAPHFAGVCESGVKSIKYHIKRVLNDTKLTYEEFLTILTQVEACVNSRPLYPMSPEPDDPMPLTPAHFLIGEPLTSVPTPDYTQIKDNLLSRHKLTQKLTQNIWRRWSKEYVSELQVRSKWKRNHPSLLQPGVIVVIKEDNLPPNKWSLGKVLELHPGRDGVSRVVTVKTSTGVYKRPVTRLCVLPGSVSAVES